MKKTFILILALVAGAGTLFAESGKCGENLTWDLTNGVLTISGKGDMYDYQETPGGSYRTSAPWAKYNNSIKSIVITSGVTSIGNWAFYYCVKATSVTLGKSLQRIGSAAFRYCEELTTPIVIPANIEKIGSEAFSYCAKVPSLTLNENLRVIGSGAFWGMDSIKSVVIPDKVDTIELQAFDGCSHLETVTIGENVKYIATTAFHKYNGAPVKTVVWKVKNYGKRIEPNVFKLPIRSFVFGENVESIPDEILSESHLYITSITIPASVKTIGKESFTGCSQLTSVVWNATFCGDNTNADDAPFYTMRQKITSFTFGDKVEFIPSYLCYQMTKLAEVTIPASVLSIGNHAFDGCTKITNIVVPNDVTTLGEYAFANCGLTSATIGNNVSSIGKYAFMGNESMSAVYNEAVTPQSITANVFSDVNLPGCDLYVPESSISAYKNANVWKTFKSFNPICRYGSGTDGGIKWYHSCSGHLSISGTGAMPDYTRVESIPTAPWRSGGAVQDHTILSAEVSDGITNIGDNAFYNCRDMAQVYIPNSVKTIGQSSFYGCQVLEAVTLSDNITSIGWNAFNQCSALKSITLPVHLKSIEGQAFFMCSGLTSLEIPNEVTEIGEDAFGYCTGLLAVTIPASVTSIGARAFAGDTKLEAIRNDAMTPQAINANVFGSLDKSKCKLIVPKNALAAYLNAPVWKEFDILTGTDVIAAGICGAEGDNLTWTLMADGQLTINGTGEMGWTSAAAPWDTWKASVLSVVISNGATNIRSYAFSQCEALSQIEIPNSVTVIGDGAFFACYGLSEITIPSTVTSLGNYTFLQCYSLTSIVIPEGVTSIGSMTFGECSNLAEVTIPSTVTSIGAGAFKSCSSLTSIVLPAALTTINASAFMDCVGLETVTNKALTPQVIEANVFSGVTLSEVCLYVPESAVNTYKNTAVWQDFYPIVPIGTIPTAVDQINQQSQIKNQKLIKNGQLLIVRDGKIYTVTGQRVQ